MPALLAAARGQLQELADLIAGADEQALARPCRAKLGDGTIAACATHAARNYGRISAYVQDLAATAEQPATGAPERRRRRGLLRRAAGRISHRPPEGGHGQEAPDGRERLLERLATAQQDLATLGELDGDTLAGVPEADRIRFADGRRTNQEILEALLKHQAHQVAAVRAALA